MRIIEVGQDGNVVCPKSKSLVGRILSCTGVLESCPNLTSFDSTTGENGSVTCGYTPKENN